MQSLNQKTNTRNLITFLLNFISLEDNSIYKDMLSAFYVFEHCICLEPEKKIWVEFCILFLFLFPPPRTKFFEKNLVNQLIKKCWPYLSIVGIDSKLAGGTLVVGR